MNLYSLFAQFVGGPIPELPPDEVDASEEPTVVVPTKFFSCYKCGCVSVPNYPICPSCHLEHKKIVGEPVFDPYTEGRFTLFLVSQIDESELVEEV